MNIKTKFPHHPRCYIVARLGWLSMVFIFLYCGTLSLHGHFQISRESLFPLSSLNMTYVNYLNRCSIPYDDCRCSVLSNKSDESRKCITDIAAMAGHLLPLVSCALQIYGISTLFSFTGYYSQLLTDIFWVIALFIFVIIAISVYGSSCLNEYTSFTITLIGLLLVGFFMYLVKLTHDHNSVRERHKTYHHERAVVTNNQERETIITITVS